MSTAASATYLGYETALGTAVDPTRQLLGDFEPALHQDFKSLSDSPGWLIDRVRGGWRDKRSTVITYHEPLQFETLPNWLALAVRGNVTPTLLTAAGPGALYGWEFVADDYRPTTKSATMYWALPPHQQAATNLMFRFPGAEVSGIEIVGDAMRDDGVKLKISGGARGVDLITPVGGLPAAGRRQSINASRCRVWLDTGGASYPAFGATAYPVGVNSFRIKWNWPTVYSWPGDGRLDWVYSTRQGPTVEASLTLRVNAAAIAEIQSHPDGLERLLRIQIGDSVTPGVLEGFELDEFEVDPFEGVGYVPDTLNQYAVIDLPGYWHASEPSTSGDAVLVTMTLVGHGRNDIGWQSRFYVVTTTSSLTAA